jgi:UDP-perosamine 4-acetyltransferase
MATDIIVLGAGGHAKMVIEAARSQGDFQPVACLAPDVKQPSSLLDVPLYSETPEQLQAFLVQGCAAFVAVGNNALRRRISGTLKKLGFCIPSIVASHAWLSPSAKLGEGCLVMHSCVIGADAQIGPGCIINNGATVDHDCRIGAYTHVAPGCHLAGNVSVGEQAFLGVGTSVIPERTIGDAAVLGAGAVVVSDIPGHGVYVGCPARPMQRARLAA